MSRSMTGFASVTQGGLIVTLKSVNHRGLDLHISLPPSLEPQELEIRALLKESIQRGSVQLRVTIMEQASTCPGILNRGLLRLWHGTFQEAAGELDIPTAIPDLNQFFRLPGALLPPATPAIQNPLPALHQAVADFNSFRDREGAAIGAELAKRTQFVHKIAAQIAQFRTTAVQDFHRRLTTRLSELLSSSIDPQRLAQEAAILADRSDVSEELLRLQTHTAQLAAILATPGEKGKKLDFLLQEMNRETNTILSKTSGLGETGLTITDLALAAKSEIDKIREQSLNLE